MKLRAASLLSVALLSSFAAFGAGCVVDRAEGARDSNEVVDVPHTDVERQSIGNCWLYAHASWTESMHLAATGEAFDVSQSYWTYWYWFDQIAAGYTNEVVTGDWEVPATINHTWGFKTDDVDWKTPEDITFKLVDIASKGGNYLLNVGPTSEGIVPQASQDNLRAVGRWLKINGEAIYGAGPTPFAKSTDDAPAPPSV